MLYERRREYDEAWLSMTKPMPFILDLPLRRGLEENESRVGGVTENLGKAFGKRPNSISPTVLVSFLERKRDEVPSKDEENLEMSI